MTSTASGKKQQDARDGLTRVRRPRLSAKNRQLLAFIEKLRSTPDTMGDEWWEKFEKDLEDNRLSFDRDPE